MLSFHLPSFLPGWAASTGWIESHPTIGRRRATMGRRTRAISRLEFLLSRALSTEHRFRARLRSGHWSDRVHRTLPGFLLKKNIIYYYYEFIGCTGASQVALWQRICLPMQETWVGSLGREHPPNPGVGSGNNPLQYSCLENSMARGAWRTTVRGVAKSQTRLTK